MSLTPNPVPQDLTGWTAARPEEVAALLERAAEAPDPEVLDSLTGLLVDRALQLLRQGSRQDIFEEAKAVNRFLAGPGGDALRESRLQFHGGWSFLGELLSEAARRSDRAAVESILLSTKGRGRSLLEELARHGGPLPRVEIRKRLKIGESHLSHLLRDLEEADLIVRYRPEGSKEVLLDLGPVGREVTGHVLSQRASRGPMEGLLGKLLWFQRKMVENKKDNAHFEVMSDRQRNCLPRALFAAKR